MNYDRLLQLGGIDREVPPLPGYITKEELKEDINDINEKIPEETSSDNQLADKAYVNNKVSTDSLFQKNLAAIMSLAVDPNAGVTTVTTNPEWKLVYTDNDDRILLGKRQDNTWYFAIDLDTILDVIIAGYTAN